MNKYIERTILSILNQSFQDYEIIIVNDGSIDRTLEVAHELKGKYSKLNKYIKIKK